MDATSIILLYETLAVNMRKMLVAAKNQSWEELIRLDAESNQFVTALKAHDEDTKRLSGKDRERQIELINQILKDNESVRNFIEPNLAELSQKIHSNNNEQKLLKTYGNLGR